jgi:hypothetical protein
MPPTGTSFGRGAEALYRALDPRRNDNEDIARMTPEEQVLLLHVME